MERLNDEVIRQKLSKLPEWNLEEKLIHRRYRFASFPAAIAFVNRVAEIAEEKNHHPFISIDYKMVTVRLTSWHAGGLTDLDFNEAAYFDTVYAEMTD
ncbi:4a-hydroxytetrahydrobiopterin dehydratase [Alicyclobacillus dauci]|uniref:Putative pterin-4-alpha-carbinolamine dehydratase n=1 Tax=Alicyclobacillus dauci TaxID=1475485 RepID=A0ABY6Z3M6_9BACL|nr:4a-hydroxytetrahydrobiopterin dehydratase [Alicyclobacillus dauci]WAH37267.1 4a-hydroxytetrahydrobiopterin dehydratase [Alicyclobacillus dauci]